ncbi:MAG TPA: M23 family metallopeptidase [Chroococcales cyanobacterium]
MSSAVAISADEQQEEICVDEFAHVDAEKDTDGLGVTFYASTSRVTQLTITLECADLENLTPTSPMPCTFLLKHPATHEPFLSFRQTAPGRWHYGKWKSHYERGLVSDRPTVDYIYSLPYSSTEKHKIGQTYFGEFSHQQGTHSQYAVDFDMPVGTSILAARPGTVMAVRGDSSQGGPDKRYERCGNYVIVDHGDGTYAEYWHLRQAGVLVRLGQPVQVGTPIGLSGETGFARGPHLHFEVFRVVDGRSNASLPFKMRTEEGVREKLEKGNFY